MQVSVRAHRIRPVRLQYHFIRPLIGGKDWVAHSHRSWTLLQVLVCPEKSRPEENKEQKVLEYTAAVDAWAIGIVCFELLVGHPPFEKKSQAQTYEHIMYRAPEMPSCLSVGAKQFITSALVKVILVTFPL